MIDFDGEVYENLKYMGMQIPEHTQQSLNHYLLHGFNPGGFVSAMLAGDLERALYCADTGNRQMFWAIDMWIRERAPAGSWGSYEAIDVWCLDQNGQRTAYRNEVEKQAVWKRLQKVTA